jgi:itaconate CoA-transferase
MYAYSGILAALFERERSGRGRHIDISMLEAMAEWMSHPMYYAFEGASPPPRVGSTHATIFPYGLFRTADGEVMLGVQNEREWLSFCSTVLLAPDLAKDERFVTGARRNANREALTTIIEACFVTLPRDVVLARLEKARIANANVNDMAGLWAHPQLSARHRWREVATPAGPIPALLPPGQEDARMDPVPACGEHTAAILAELSSALYEGAGARSEDSGIVR